jgi:hypothetical protein
MIVRIWRQEKLKTVSGLGTLDQYYKFQGSMGSPCFRQHTKQLEAYLANKSLEGA